LDSQFAVFVTAPKTLGYSTLADIQRQIPRAQILPVDNRGRDILPFLKAVQHFDLVRYRGVCKLHSKKSPHRKDGAQWRNLALETLVKNSQNLDRIVEELQQDGTGLIGPASLVTTLGEARGSNDKHLESLAATLGTPLPYQARFFAGSMFWAGQDFIRELKNLKTRDNDFEWEQGQIDGTHAHAIERFFGVLCHMKNLRFIPIQGGEPVGDQFLVQPDEDMIIRDFRNELEL
jgi:lipopolysaccharide biosynthesis protein